MNKHENKTLLRIENLSVGFAKGRKINTVLDNISFELKKGEILGILGESGSGKTMTALAVMGLLPAFCKNLKGKNRFSWKKSACYGRKGTRKLKR